jgi:hypothetical protein
VLIAIVDVPEPTQNPAPAVADVIKDTSPTVWHVPDVPNPVITMDSSTIHGKPVSELVGVVAGNPPIVPAAGCKAKVRARSVVPRNGCTENDTAVPVVMIPPYSIRNDLNNGVPGNCAGIFAPGKVATVGVSAVCETVAVSPGPDPDQQYSNSICVPV